MDKEKKVRSAELTLQECKDQVAQKHGYESWAAWRRKYDFFPERYHNEAAEMYASQFSQLTPSSREEEQIEIWRELIDDYDVTDKSSYGYGALIDKLSAKFTINRKQ
jgi:bisphosphoglycerate-dependent phosphoglycerate mutase